MSQEWKCSEIHTDTFEQRNRLIDDIVRLMKKLKENKHLESYFFNRYSDPRQNLHFVKLGLVNADKEAQSGLDNLLKKHPVKNVKPYDCEMWEVKGIPIDVIKCVACELSERIKDQFDGKPAIEQVSYLLHFLMNQLGFSYEDELKIYRKLTEGIERQQGKR